MFSVGDVYHRVKAFKAHLGTTEQKRLYFAKVDVQAAFDTLPQSAVVGLMKTVPSERHYKLVKHVQVQPNDSGAGSVTRATSVVTKRWQSLAKGARDPSGFLAMIQEEIALKKKNTVFIDSVVQKEYDARNLLALMQSHVEQNLVKIGKKYYRQTSGIPQGSVLSSLLCNYFYADLEAQNLAFLGSEDCLLLRLIDDFLLVTTEKEKATRFVEVMHGGLPDYGVTVHPKKSLVNFDLELDGVCVPRLRDGQRFPYCGLLLDCRTLDIAKDHDSVKDPGTPRPCPGMAYISADKQQ